MGQVFFVEVDEVEKGLEGEEGVAADELLLGGRHRGRAQALARFEGRAKPQQEVPLLFALRVLRLLQVLLEPLQPRVDEDEVGQEELFLHAPDVRDRVHPSAGVGDVLAAEGADHVDEAVGLAKVAEEEACLDLAEGDPDEVGQVERSGDLRLLGVGRGDPVQAGIGEGNGAHVRLPLAVVVGPDRGAGAGEEVEQRRLARLGVAEQGHVHGTSKAGLSGGVKASEGTGNVLDVRVVFLYSRSLWPREIWTRTRRKETRASSGNTSS